MILRIASSEFRNPKHLENEHGSLKYWLALQEALYADSRMMHEFCEARMSPSEIAISDTPKWSRLAKKMQTHLRGSFRSLFYYLSSHEEIRLCTICDDEYPQLLKSIYDPPPLLFCRGTNFILPEKMLAIVGTRKPSRASVECTQTLVSELAEKNFCIVSGLAMGIDRVAHQAALANHIPTIGVSACGIDLIYPAVNAELFHQIYREGQVVSEFPIGMSPKPFHFPRRNRIISGLSKAVLLIEAPEKSGALITARAALEQGREVLVVEWDKFTEETRGNQRLLDEGATPIRSGQDIMDQFKSSFSAAESSQLQ